MNKIVSGILSKRLKVPIEQSLLVGISGIDAGGKSFIAAKLTEAIRLKGFNVATINIDGWLNLPPVRFDKTNAAENFYENAIRFDEMFEKLILPLKINRSIKLIADLTEETATEYRKHEYFYENVEILLLEGIFLFKKEFRELFDLKIWVECPFEIALQRAIARSQEGLSTEETIKSYKTIYFPAQKIHFARDFPQTFADLVYNNDKF